MKSHEIYQEVKKEVDECRRLRRLLDPTVLTITILGRHKDIEGIDADWHKCNSYDNVRSLVRNCIRAGGSEDKVYERNRTPFLPGYEYLQDMYLITRQKVQV